jgi:hypothetical protein
MPFKAVSAMPSRYYQWQLVCGYFSNHSYGIVEELKHTGFYQQAYTSLPLKYTERFIDDKK